MREMGGGMRRRGCNEAGGWGKERVKGRTTRVGKEKRPRGKERDSERGESPREEYMKAVVRIHSELCVCVVPVIFPLLRDPHLLLPSVFMAFFSPLSFGIALLIEWM